MKYVKLALTSFFVFIAICLITILISNLVVEKSTNKKVFCSTTEIPHNKVGLLLGTSKKLPNGNINLYYQYRLEAACKLFKEGKIDFVLVSGDNSTKYYNEPMTIKNDLIKMGIPAHKIFLDYAGFRTLDSVIRCKEIFGQEDITIISQKFHNERAIFIASQKGINAIGFNAKDVTIRYGIKTLLRERFARVKMMLDLISSKKPKFLGEKIEIN